MKLKEGVCILRINKKKVKLASIGFLTLLVSTLTIVLATHDWSNDEGEEVSRSTPFFSKNYNLNTQFKDNYFIKCSYSYGKNGNILDVGNDEIINNHIVCLVVKKDIENENENYVISNSFPAIEFINLNNRLSPLETKDYLVNKTNDSSDQEVKLIEIETKDDEKTFKKTVKNVYVKKQVLLDQEKNARLVAMKITKTLLSTLSYGSELSLLDTIRFVEVKKDFQGIYNRPLNMTFDTSERRYDQVLEKNVFSNNLRTIQTIIKPLYRILKTETKDEYGITDLPDFVFNTTTNKVETYKDYKIYQKDNEDFSNITFDLYDTLHTLVHEYGHHLTLYNEKLDASSFLDFLERITENSDESQKFSDFKTFYKYINRLNADDEKNAKENDLTLDDYNDNDQKMLEIYRKYYSGRVTKLKNKLSPYSEDAEWQTRTFNDLSYGILKDNPNTQVPPILKNAINKALIRELDNDLKIDKVAYNELLDLVEKEGYNVYYWDKDDSFYFVEDDPYRVTNFWLVSKNFGNEDDRKPAKVSDVFNNQKYVLNKLNEEDELANRIRIKENACDNEPINFAGLGPHNYEADIFFNTTLWGSEDSYEEMSKKADVIMLNKLKYYFSWKELAARLFAITTFRYSDKRDTISTCSRDYKRIERDDGKKLAYSFQKTSDLKTMELYSDYSTYRVFDINPLEKEKEVFSFFHEINVLDENIKKPFFVLKNNDLQKSSQQNQDKEFNYFLSNNYNFTTLNSNTFWNSLSGYVLLNIYSEESLKDVKIEFESGIVKKPFQFNYNNLAYFSIESNSPPSIDDYDLTKKVFLLDSSQLASLAINLGWYEKTKGNQVLSYDLGKDKKTNGSYNTQKLYSFADIDEKYSIIKTIWVDSNNNDQVDANERIIPIIP